MAAAVYILCALTSLACAILLWRGYRQTRASLLFWSSLCFSGLFLNNVMLIVDVNFPATDLALWRMLPGLAGVVILIYGLILETDQ